MKQNAARTAAIVAGVLVALLAAGWGYAAWQKRAQQKALAAVVADTTDKLRRALAAPPPADLVRALEANAEAARAPRDPAFAEAAGQYVVTAREIARRRADAARLAQESAAARAALDAHMARSASRGAGWIEQAVALKKKAGDLEFQLGLSRKGLDELLRTMPESAKGLEPYVAPASLVDAGALQKAREEGR